MVSVYVLAVACVAHGSCQQGYFLLKNPALVSCEQDILPMVDGRHSRNQNGQTVIWHAQGCETSAAPPKDRQMLGMF